MRRWTIPFNLNIYLKLVMPHDPWVEHSANERYWHIPSQDITAWVAFLGHINFPKQ